MRPLLLTLLLLALFRPAAAQTYGVTDLGTLGGTNSAAVAINASGDIIGWSGVAQSEGFHPFLIHGGRMQEILAPEGHQPAAHGINSKSRVVGLDIMSTSSLSGFLFSNGKLILLEKQRTLGDANGINEQGQITGGRCFFQVGVKQYAYLYEKGQFTPLGTLAGYDHSYGMSINRQGWIAGVAGTSLLPDADTTQAFCWHHGQMAGLGTLGGRNSLAFAINDKNEVVGVADLKGGHRHAFLYKAGKLKDLGSLSGYPDSFAEAINNRGAIVGTATDVSLEKTPYDAYAQPHVGSAFLYHDGEMNDLNRLIPANAGWILRRANGINDKGQIVGDGEHNGLQRAFLLTPKH